MIFELLKIISLLIGSILGIYGTTHDFKKDGKVTKSGYKAITGLIICGVVAIAIEVHDFWQKESATQEANRQLTNNIARQNQLVRQTESANTKLGEVAREIDRGVKRLSQPLKEVYFSYTIEYGEADKRFPAYWKRMELLHQRVSNGEGNVLEASAPADHPQLMDLSTYSHFFPTNGEGRADETLNFTQNLISIFLGKEGFATLPEIEFRAYAWKDSARFLVAKEIERNIIRVPNKGTTMELQFDFDKKIIKQHIGYAAVQLVRNTGSVSSVSDIRGPEKPEEVFIQIAVLADAQFGKPRIVELTVHFDETGHNILNIRGDKLRERELGGPGGGGHVDYYCSVADTDQFQDALDNQDRRHAPK